MLMRLRRIMLLAALVAARAALADDYPTAPDDKDELCEAIVKRSVSSIPPRDLVWFQASCRCVENVRCGSPASERFQAAVAAEQRKRDEAEAARESSELSRAVETCGAFAACLKAHPGDASACEQQETGLEYQCSAVRRDLEGCQATIDAIRKAPAAAACSSIRRD
jgi:hypothetical protein